MNFVLQLLLFTHLFILSKVFGAESIAEPKNRNTFDIYYIGSARTESSNHTGFLNYRLEDGYFFGAVLSGKVDFLKPESSAINDPMLRVGRRFSINSSLTLSSDIRVILPLTTASHQENMIGGTQSNQVFSFKQGPISAFSFNIFRGQFYKSSGPRWLFFDRTNIDYSLIPVVSVSAMSILMSTAKEGQGLKLGNWSIGPGLAFKVAKGFTVNPYFTVDPVKRWTNPSFLLIAMGNVFAF